MLGISTCWWHGRIDRGDAIVEEILDEGLTGVEFDYRITPRLYREMMPLLNRSIEVLSIHNIFPVPEHLGIREGGGNLFLPSSEDREERSLAVQSAAGQGRCRFRRIACSSARRRGRGSRGEGRGKPRGSARGCPPAEG